MIDRLIEHYGAHDYVLFQPGCAFRFQLSLEGAHMSPVVYWGA